MACCGTAISEQSDHVDDGCFHAYRKTSPDGDLATIFNADDPKSFYSWRLELGRETSLSKGAKQRPRFRQIIDKETTFAAFELTGNHDGTVFLACPPIVPGECSRYGIEEQFPCLNFIMTDLGAYSSVEIEITDTKNVDRKIIAKNFVSRTCIEKSILEIPMRLKPSWNYVSLDLRQLTKDAWNTRYLTTRKIRFNANFRLRRVYFTSRPLSYDELPHEFQMSLNPTIKTLKEIKEYEEALGPKAKDLDRYLRPWIKNFETKDKPKRLSHKPNMIDEGNAKTKFQNKQSISSDDDKTHNMSTTSRGLRLSMPSNVELLQKLMNSSLQLKKNGAQSTNYLWSYPKPKKRRSRRFDVGLTQSVYKSLEERINVMTSNSKEGHEWLKDMETSDLEPFCAYIWKQTDEDSKGEWDKIQNFNLNPKLVAKINRQRRGEGLYDIFNGKMVAKEEIEFFGFGDNDEKEAEYLQDRKSLRLLMQKLDEEEKDEIDFETFFNQKKPEKKSWEESGGDWEFLESVTKGGVNSRNSQVKQSEIITEDIIPPKDNFSGLHDSEKSIAVSSTGSDDWLLTWTYQGMNWKQTREQNEKLLDQELGVLQPKDEDLEKASIKETSSMPSMTNSYKATSVTHLSPLNKVAIPSKPLMKPANGNEDLKGTEAFYHLYFDSKILPFRN